MGKKKFPEIKWFHSNSKSPLGSDCKQTEKDYNSTKDTNKRANHLHCELKKWRRRVWRHWRKYLSVSEVYLFKHLRRQGVHIMNVIWICLYEILMSENSSQQIGLVSGNACPHKTHWTCALDKCAHQQEPQHSHAWPFSTYLVWQ